MKKIALILAAAMLLTLAFPLVAFADENMTFSSTSADTATEPEPNATPVPVAETETADTATAASPEAEAMAAVGAQTLTDIVVDKLKNGESNTVRVGYNPDIVLTAEIMQALKDSEGKILVMTELRNDYPLWKLTIQYNFVTADPARPFKPDFSFEQDIKSAALTIKIGRDRMLFGTKVKVSVPKDNGKLENDAELLADKVTLYRLNNETQKYEKVDKQVKIDDKDYVTFIIDAGGTYCVKNDMSK